MSIQFLLPMGTILGEEPASSLLCGFAFAFDRHSSQTCLIHEKFWPRSEYCLCSKTKFWSQLHFYRANNWLQLLIRAQFGSSLGSILLVVMLVLLLEECIHDRPLHGIVRILQCLSPWSTVHTQQHSEILHPNKNAQFILLWQLFN